MSHDIQHLDMEAIVVLLVGFAFAPFHLAEAQQPGKVHRIGVFAIGIFRPFAQHRSIATIGQKNS